jgi:hypothetical protein
VSRRYGAGWTIAAAWVIIAVAIIVLGAVWHG